MVLLLWRDLLLMQSYMDAVRHVYERGEDVLNERTGSYTRSVTGLTISHDCSKSFPIPTARRVALRIAFEEMMFFFRGDTNTLLLEEKNIGIWKGNTTREFLDKRGLRYLQVGDMGKGYGYQWRNFFGVDQLKRCFQELLDNPSSRQNLVSAWNPAELNQMALPPCHFSFQPLVRNGRIDLNVFLRSNDLPYGTPYNLMGYGFLLECMVNFMRNNGVQVNSGTLNLMIGDAHIYQNQMIGEFGLYNRGLKTATWAVLRDTNMPSCLAEMAFISNPEEEQLLATQQDRWGACIARGITDYCLKMGI